jgi:hypothetical protein
MPATFARIHGNGSPSVRERVAAPVSRSTPPPGLSTAESDPWMYDWLAKGNEW